MNNNNSKTNTNKDNYTTRQTKLKPNNSKDKKTENIFNPILKNETTQIELRPLKPREQYVLVCRIVRRYYNLFGSFFL